MIEISEIIDRDSLEKWLDQQPQETAAEQAAFRASCIWIAQRCTLRVFPQFFTWGRSQRPDLTVFVLRANLTAGVARKYPTPAVKSAAHAAAFTFFPDAASLAAEAAAFAAFTAYAEAASSTADAASFAFVAYADAASSTTADASSADGRAVWDAVRMDCHLFDDPDQQDKAAVWQGDSPLRQEWIEGRDWMLSLYDDSTEVRARQSPEGVDLRFWVDWHEAAMRGKPLNWDMQHEIALIEDDVWEGDLSVLMDRINGIWRSYVLKNSTNSERLERDVNTGLITSVPESNLSDVLCENAIHQMERAIARLRRAENEIVGFPWFRNDLSEVEDRLAFERDRMIALHDSALDFVLNTKALIDGEKVQSDSAVLNTALRDFERSASEFYGGDEKVRQILAARVAARVDRIKQDDAESRAMLNAAANAESDEKLSSENNTDLSVLNDPKADSEAKARSATRWGGRMIRTRDLKVDEISKGAETVNKTAKTVGSLEKIWDTAGSIWHWFV